MPRTGFLLDGYPRNLGQVGAPRRVPRRARTSRSTPSSSSASRATESIDAARRCARASRGAPTTPRRPSPTASTIYERETAPILDVYRERGHRRRDRRRRLARRDHRPHLRGARGARDRAACRGLSASATFRRSIYKSPAQLRAMVEPGLITAAALDAVRAADRARVSRRSSWMPRHPRVITGRGAESNFQMVRGYRHTICTSVNEQVVHGIPGARVLEPGDIVSIDAGAEYRGLERRLGLHRRRAGSVAPRGGRRARGALARHRGVAVGRHRCAGDRPPSGRDRRRDRRTTSTRPGRRLRHPARLRRPRHRPQDARVAIGLQLPRLRPGRRGARRGSCSRSSPWSSSATRRPSSRTTTGRSRPLDGTAGSHWEHSVAVHDGGIWVLTAPDGGAAGLAPFGVTPAAIA